MPTKNILAFHTTIFFSILRSNIYNYFLFLSFRSISSSCASSINHEIHFSYFFICLNIKMIVSYSSYVIFFLHFHRSFYDISNGFKLSGYSMKTPNINANFSFAYYLIINCRNIYSLRGLCEKVKQ